MSSDCCGLLLSSMLWHMFNYLKMYALDRRKTHFFSTLAFAVFKKCKQYDKAISITYCLLEAFVPHVCKWHYHKSQIGILCIYQGLF